MEADDGPSSPPKSTTVAPITSVIANQVKRLRTRSDLSGPALARRLADLGVNWTRTTVAKFETGLRGSLTVQELLALALALDVPVIWLLADVESGERTPLAQSVDVDPWTALLWLAGRWPLHEEPGVWWTRTAPSISAAFAYSASVDQLRRNEATRQFLAMHEDTTEHLDSRADADERDRSALRGVAMNMTYLQRAGLTLPEVPEDVRVRAAELGVNLPEAED